MITIRNRRMIVPAEERHICVEGDNNTTSREFLISKKENDLTGLSYFVDILYENGQKNENIILDPINKENEIILTWQVISNDVPNAGTVLIQLKATDLSGMVKWKSYMEPFYIEGSIGAGEEYSGELSVYETLAVRMEQIASAEAERIAAEIIRKNSYHEIEGATDSANEAANRAHTSADRADNKIIDVESRFNLLTSQQQQESEVIDARKGKSSLKEKMDEVDMQSASNTENIKLSTNSQRSAIIYRDADNIRVIGRSFQMLGFRFFGQYLKNKGLYGDSPDTSNLVSTITDLGAETEKSLNNWYGVFATMNEEDSQVQFKVMPFLRVCSISENTITLGEGGENSNYLTPKIYTFATDGLANTDVLVINEKVDHRSNSFSGRVAKVVGNTDTTLTLDDIGQIEGSGEYLLPAPPNFTDYRYLGSFYIDTQEVRNLADDGTIVRTRGVNHNSATIDNDISAGVYVDMSGFVSPLATAVIFTLTQSIATSGTGTFYVYYGLDHAHDFYATAGRKDITTTLTHIDYGIEIPFGYRGRVISLRSTGTMAPSATRVIAIRGHKEI